MSIERRLLETEKELAALRKNFKEYLSVVTHDMSCSLRTSSGFAEIVFKQNDQLLSEKSKKHLNLIYANAITAKRTLDQLRVYANLLIDPHEFDQDVCIESLLVHAVKELDEPGLSSNTTIEFDNMPSIVCESQNIQLLCTALIANSLMYAPEDQPPIIIISASSQPTEWQFSIQDNAIEIPEKNADSIFKPLRRGVKKDGPAGSGMGLAIARRIVERHKGEITLDRSQIKGNLFSFTISKNLVI